MNADSYTYDCTLNIKKDVINDIFFIFYSPNQANIFANHQFTQSYELRPALFFVQKEVLPYVYKIISSLDFKVYLPY